MRENTIKCLNCGESNRAVRKLCWVCGMVIRTGKPQVNQFLERNRQLVHDHLENGETYAVLAERYSISPARVHQILQDYGPKTICQTCGVENRYLYKDCFNCGASLE